MVQNFLLACTLLIGGIALGLYLALHIEKRKSKDRKLDLRLLDYKPQEDPHANGRALVDADDFLHAVGRRKPPGEGTP